MTRRSTWTDEYRLAAYAAIAFACSSCGGTREPGPLEHGAAAPPVVADAPPPDPPAPADGCAQLASLEPGRIQMVPENVVVFSHASEPCTALRSGFLLRNRGTAPIGVTGLSVTPDTFHLGTLALPANVAPGDTLRVELGYARTSFVDDSVAGNLRVMTPQGCTDFEVRGLSTDGSLMTYSELAIDFGTLPASTASAARTVKVLSQRTRGFPQSVFSGFSADPPAIFDIVSEPEPDTRLESCESLSVELRMIAPAAPGPVDGGGLFWRMQTESPQGNAEATIYVPLSGRVE